MAVEATVAAGIGGMLYVNHMRQTTPVVQEPEAPCGQLARVLESCRARLEAPMRLSPFALDGNLDTAMAYIRRGPSWMENEIETEAVVTWDGGTLELDWLYLRDSKSTGSLRDTSAPIVIIVHGLNGHSNESYVRFMMAACREHGWHSCAMNFRGCGSVPFTSPYAYNGCFTGDVRHVCSYVHAKHPNAPLVGIGYSLGANLLVKYLGEEGDLTPLCCAVSVANPWDFNAHERAREERLRQELAAQPESNSSTGNTSVATADQQHRSIAMDQWEALHTLRQVQAREHMARRRDGATENGECIMEQESRHRRHPTLFESRRLRLYEIVLANTLKQFIEKHKRVLSRSPDVDVTRTREVRTLRDFDRLYVVPMFGFRSLWHYLTEGSSWSYVEYVRVPLLCVNALNDPLIPSTALPLEQAKRNPYCVFVTTKHGGHIGWCQGVFPWFSPSWVDQVACAFMEAAIEQRPPQEPDGPPPVVFHSKL